MTFGRKIRLTLSVFALLSVGASFVFAYVLYEKLYVETVKQEIEHVAKQAAYAYPGGELTNDYIEQVEWLGRVSSFEAFAVNNPRELAACIPYEADYETLIGAEERERLLHNEPVEKIGYSSRFDRQIISVAYPLLEGAELKGIVYIYTPLERITDFAAGLQAIWATGAAVLILLLFSVGFLWTRYATKPLITMKDAAALLQKGDLTVRVHEASRDEFGQLARTFNQMAASLEQEDEQRKAFIASVSHELRTPVSYIKGYSEAALKGIGDQQKQLRIISREAVRMERLVEDLLLLTKVDAGKMTLNKTILPLADIVYRAAETFQLKHPLLSLQVDESVIVNGDEHRLMQVLENVLENAMRYSKADQPITVSLETKQGEAMITVTDSGMGIPEQDLPFVTERFYRVQKARTRHDGGSGLGLAIVKEIMEQHGGRLHIVSREGKGTAVYLTLPVYDE